MLRRAALGWLWGMGETVRGKEGPVQSKVGRDANPDPGQPPPRR